MKTGEKQWMGYSSSPAAGRGDICSPAWRWPVKRGDANPANPSFMWVEMIRRNENEWSTTVSSSRDCVSAASSADGYRRI